MENDKFSEVCAYIRLSKEGANYNEVKQMSVGF